MSSSAAVPDQAVGLVITAGIAQSTCRHGHTDERQQVGPATATAQCRLGVGGGADRAGPVGWFRGVHGSTEKIDQVAQTGGGLGLASAGPGQSDGQFLAVGSVEVRPGQ